MMLNIEQCYNVLQLRTGRAQTANRYFECIIEKSRLRRLMSLAKRFESAL